MKSQILLLIAVLALASCSQVQESEWDLSSRVVRLNGKDVVLKGLALTCGEYFLRGVGMKCWSQYNWNNASDVIRNPDPVLLGKIKETLVGTSATNALPSIRITLNAGYYLNVVTSQWSGNNDKYVDLSGQYRDVLDKIITNLTSEGIVVILDLHWNSDAQEQQQMAQAGDNTTGDSIEFWDALAQKYANNSMVWYELYNEPYTHDYDLWANANGTNGYWGYKPMYDTVRKYTNNPVLVAGKDYAYGYDWCVQFYKDYQPINVAYNFHPYMGKNQAGDTKKNADGYLNQITQLQSQINKPAIATEFGSACAPQGGEKWYDYNGTFDSTPMSYVEAIMKASNDNQVSWMKWGLRPGTIYGAGSCSQNDIYNSGDLITVDSSDDGADLLNLFPKYY